MIGEPSLAPIMLVDFLMLTGNVIQFRTRATLEQIDTEVSRDDPESFVRLAGEMENGSTNHLRFNKMQLLGYLVSPFSIQSVKP